MTREDAAGKYISNYNLMDNLRPSILTDNQERVSRKSFILQTLAAIPNEFIIQQTYRIIDERFQRWSKIYRR